MYGIRCLDPRVLLNVLQIGEDQFLQSDLSEEARNLCTTISQSLQAVDAKLLVEGASTDTSNRGYRKYVMLSTDLNIQAKKDCWFSDASDSSQDVASEVLRYLTRCVQLQKQQPTSTSRPTSPASDFNPDLFDVIRRFDSNPTAATCSYLG